MDEISFGTDGWRATLDTFTDDRVRVIGQAIAGHLVDESFIAPALVGYDARETSPDFAESLAEVVAGNGSGILLPERDCLTPLVAYTIVDRGLSGMLMVTASYNPPEYNGVKLIPSGGAPVLPDVTDAVARRLAEPDLLPESERDTIERVDVVSPHADHAMNFVGDDLSDLTAVYGAMHGSGRGVTDAPLEAADAEVVRLRCERDADFGGISPEPSAENLSDLAEAMAEHDADLGVANDGDADRIGITTPDRGVLDENLFFAFVYDYLFEFDPGPTIRTVSTTFLIDHIAEAHGEEVFGTAAGFKWVADGMREHDTLVDGEESGGFSVHGHVREKDGVLMGLLAAAATVEEDFDARLDRIEAEHGDIVADKISVACPDAEKARVIDGLENVLPETVAGRDIAKVVTFDGFKLLLDDGLWLLVRPPGTEPKMRVYAEAGSEDAVSTLLEAGRELVKPFV